MDRIKVLVADDNVSDRLILSSILHRQGHEVIEAANGREAIDQFIEHKPDLVLLDALMPEMDGFEAAQCIKCEAGEDLIPIIFLTSLKDAASLAKCLEAGGDDFLSKPYNQIILEAKIQAFHRMRQMHETLRQQRDQIAKNNSYLLQEQRVAKAVFDNVAHSGCLDAPNIQYLLSSLAVFNGDALLAAYKPSGGMHILLGDFTGHGLPAAIGAMPLAEIFYGMSAKGFGMTDILAEINMKLKGILPVGVFCCAGMVEISFRKRTMSVWLGGLPDCYMLRQSGEIMILKSNHLPLGILKPKAFDVSTMDFQMELGDRFYLWSDGILEARNEKNKMYGEQRLRNLFDEVKNPEELFDSLKNDVATFMEHAARDDDITLLEVLMVDTSVIHADKIELQIGTNKGPTDWSMTYRLGPSTLRDFNPLPLLLHLLMEVPGLRPHSGALYTVLAELYSNALEHGVIGLKSNMKSNPAGFIEYYRKRTEALLELEKGFVQFVFEHSSTANGGLLRLLVEDSGEGFEYCNGATQDLDDDDFHGRGIPLLRTLCRKVQFKGRGNEVEAVFEWQSEA